MVAYADPARSLVRVVGHGFWTRAVIEDHFIELTRVAAQVRRGRAGVLVLVDLREAAVQTPEVADRIQRHTRAIWSGQDRIAVVVRSVLSGMQINRVVTPGNHATFDSMDRARAWLGLADDGER